MNLARTYLEGFAAGVAWGSLAVLLMAALGRLMPRKNAVLREEGGFRRKISRKTAYGLVRTGEFKIVQERRPLIIEQDRLRRVRSGAQEPSHQEALQCSAWQDEGRS
jgi:hypothetical protein